MRWDTIPGIRITGAGGYGVALKNMFGGGLKFKATFSENGTLSNNQNCSFVICFPPSSHMIKKNCLRRRISPLDHLKLMTFSLNIWREAVTRHM